MKVPSVDEAENMLLEAEKLNPGIWISHCRVAGQCAKTISNKLIEMDEDVAFTMGLLHDIGRRIGVCELKHVLNGYEFMMKKGYDDIAQICLTHSFPIDTKKTILSFVGKEDISSEETIFLQQQLEKTDYTDYDRLIQLCDVIAYPTGPCVIEKRLIDASIRRGINDFSVENWKAYLYLREYFEEKMGCNLYSIFEDLVL